jgi:hypothetical protein
VECVPGESISVVRLSKRYAGNNFHLAVLRMPRASSVRREGRYPEGQYYAPSSSRSLTIGFVLSICRVMEILLKLRYCLVSDRYIRATFATQQQRTQDTDS